MFYYDSTYVLILLGFIICMVAQGNVSRAFSKWDQVRSSTGLSGKEIARMILDDNGMQDVSIEHVPGNLTDHYDPENGVLRLSDAVYSSRSVAALGVAAHEAGHAIQDAQDYFPLRFRSQLVPVANIGSQASIPLFMMGLVFSWDPLVKIGIFCFAFAVLFTLVTLPVEFNASGRALHLLESGILPEEEVAGVRQVLRAAAMTYVASALQAILQMVRLLILSGNRRRRD